MTEQDIALANEAFGCFGFAMLMFSGAAGALGMLALILQWYWYG